MTRRVVLGALPGGGKGLRVSRPGYDVMSTSLDPNQISFDSRWNRAAKLQMAGSINGQGVVYYGRTFPVCPLNIVATTDSQGRYRTFMMRGSVGGNSSGTGGEVSAIRSYTNRVEFGMTAGSYYTVYVNE